MLYSYLGTQPPYTKCKVNLIFYYLYLGACVVPGDTETEVEGGANVVGGSQHSPLCGHSGGLKAEPNTGSRNQSLTHVEFLPLNEPTC